MINKHTLETLEYDKIISLIRGMCLTPYGKEAILEIKPLLDKTEIEKKSVVATKPVKPRKKVKTAKPVAISPWSTKTEIEKKSVIATPKFAKDKLKARGAMQSESNQVIKSPLPILPVPSQETVSAAPEWTVKISQNQSSK